MEDMSSLSGGCWGKSCEATETRTTLPLSNYKPTNRSAVKYYCLFWLIFQMMFLCPWSKFQTAPTGVKTASKRKEKWDPNNASWPASAPQGGVLSFLEARLGAGWEKEDYSSFTPNLVIPSELLRVLTSPFSCLRLSLKFFSAPTLHPTQRTSVAFRVKLDGKGDRASISSLVLNLTPQRGLRSRSSLSAADTIHLVHRPEPARCVCAALLSLCQESNQEITTYRHGTIPSSVLFPPSVPVMFPGRLMGLPTWLWLFERSRKIS